MNAWKLLPDNEFVPQQSEPAKVVYLAVSTQSSCLEGAGGPELPPPAYTPPVLPLIDGIPPFLKRGHPECSVGVRP